MQRRGEGWSRVDEGAWVGGDESAAVLGIIGGIHGDEIAGAELVRAWCREPSPLPCAWSLRFGLGNPRALAAKTRAIDADLNRAFGPEPLPGGYEAQRAEELKSFLEGTNVLLDVHQTHCETPPLAVIQDSPAHLAMARALGLSVAVVDAQKIYGPTMLADWVDARGGLGLTLESGRVGTAEAKEVAAGVMRRLVRREWDLGPSIRVYAVHSVMRAPFDGLNFMRSLGNGSPVSAGEVLAEKGELRLRAPGDGVVLLPQREVRQGAVAAIFAEDRGEVSVAHERWQSYLQC